MRRSKIDYRDIKIEAVEFVLVPNTPNYPYKSRVRNTIFVFNTVKDSVQ